MNVRVLILLFAVVVTGLLSSCKKGNDDATPVVKTTFLDVINASADTLNFYQNGTRINNSSNLYPFGSFGYLSVKYGLQNYEFKKAGSPNVLSGAQLTLDTIKNYTLVIAGETNDQLFLLQDALVSDTGASVRFVNASPIARSVDVTIGSSFSYKNLAFKSSTPFTHVNSGKPILSVYQSGGALLLPAGALSLTAGSAYTIYIKGVQNGIGNNAFGARIVTTHIASQ